MNGWWNVLCDTNMNGSIDWRLKRNEKKRRKRKVVVTVLPAKRLNQCTGRYRRNRVPVRTVFLPRGTIRSKIWKCVCWRSAASFQRINWCTNVPIGSAGNIPNKINHTVSKRLSDDPLTINIVVINDKVSNESQWILKHFTLLKHIDSRERQRGRKIFKRPRWY